MYTYKNTSIAKKLLYQSINYGCHFRSDKFSQDIFRLDISNILEKKVIFKLLDKYVKDGSCVADLECGDGIYSINLALRECKLQLVDVSHHLLRLAYNRIRILGMQENVIGINNLSPINLSALESAKFDAVLLLGTLPHLLNSEERKQTISETYRILKPNGIIIASGTKKFASLRSLSQNRKYREFDYSKSVVKFDNESTSVEINSSFRYNHLLSIIEFKKLFDVFFSEIEFKVIESINDDYLENLKALNFDERFNPSTVKKNTTRQSNYSAVLEQIIFVGLKN